MAVFHTSQEISGERDVYAQDSQQEEDMDRNPEEKWAKPDDNQSVEDSWDEQAISDFDSYMSSPMKDDRASSESTRKIMQWAMRRFVHWKKQRNASGEGDKVPDDLFENPVSSELEKWLSLFRTDIRNREGEPYTPASLNTLMSGLRRHIKKKSDLHQLGSTKKCLLPELSQEEVGTSSKEVNSLTSEDKDQQAGFPLVQSTTEHSTKKDVESGRTIEVPTSFHEQTPHGSSDAQLRRRHVQGAQDCEQGTTESTELKGRGIHKGSKESVEHTEVHGAPDDKSEVPGIEVCGQTLLEITGNKPQKISWESHGFCLTIPEGAVPSGATVRVRVKAILEGRFELPKNTQLVSAIYLVSARKTFLKEVLVQIQHCAKITSKEEATNYKMIVGECPQESLPYTFQIRDGLFLPVGENESQLATISVKNFCFIAAIKQLWGEHAHKSPSRYMSYCYHKRDSDCPTSWRVHFMITKDLPSCQQLIEKEHKDWKQNHSPSEIKFDKPSILLEVTPAEENEPKGWVIKPVVTPLEICQKYVDKDEGVEGLPGRCELRIDWRGEPKTNPPDLTRRVNLVGAKHPKNFLLWIRPSTAAGRRKWHTIRIKTPWITISIPLPIDAEWSDRHPCLATFISIVIVISVLAFILLVMYLLFGSNNSDHPSKHSS